MTEQPTSPDTDGMFLPFSGEDEPYDVRELAEQARVGVRALGEGCCRAAVIDDCGGEEP